MWRPRSGPALLSQILSGLEDPGSISATAKSQSKTRVCVSESSCHVMKQVFRLLLSIVLPGQLNNCEPPCPGNDANWNAAISASSHVPYRQRWVASISHQIQIQVQTKINVTFKFKFKYKRTSDSRISFNQARLCKQSTNFGVGNSKGAHSTNASHS